MMMRLFGTKFFRYRPVGDDNTVFEHSQKHPSELRQQLLQHWSWRRQCLLLATVIMASLSLGCLAGIFLITPHRPGAAGPQQEIPMQMIETRFHYNRTFGVHPHSPGTAEAWDSLVPLGQGTVRFPHGSHNLYTLSVVHQLHCLWSLHQSYYELLDYHQQPPPPQQPRPDAPPHMRHCFDYLRQSLLCAGDVSLEPVDAALGGVTGWDSDRICRDYQQIVEWAENHRVSNAWGFSHATSHHEI